jgi:hypothetical protein
MFLMEYADGVRPYILEWYYDVFLEAFNAKVDIPYLFDYGIFNSNFRGNNIKLVKSMF